MHHGVHVFIAVLAYLNITCCSTNLTAQVRMRNIDSYLAQRTSEQPADKQPATSHSV